MNENYFGDNDSIKENKNEINYVENLEILNKIKSKIKDSEKILNIVINEKNNSVVYLIGSIHVSQQSCDDIKEMLSIIQPDTVFIELSNERSKLLTATDNQIIEQLLRKPKINWFTTSISDFYLSIHSKFYYYTTLISFGSKDKKSQQQTRPYIYGNEFRIGYQYSIKNKCSIILCDRDYKTTWNRVFNYLDLKTLVHVGCFGVKSFFKLYEKTPEELRELYYNSVEEMVNASWDSDIWKKDLPMAVQKGLIDERDQYMASIIRDSPKTSKRVVAIVGKGHIKGISNHINDNDEGFYVRQSLENYMDNQSFIAKYSYPIILPSLYIAPAVLGVTSFHKIIKPLSKSKFTLGVIGCISLELLSTNYLISNFINKLDKL